MIDLANAWVTVWTPLWMAALTLGVAERSVAQDPSNSMPGSPATVEMAETPLNEFPDGISPSHVFAEADLLNRQLDQVIEAWNTKKIAEKEVRWSEDDVPYAVESNLRPMHVYQALLICTWRLQQIDDHPQLMVRHIPTLSSNPREYAPRDAQYLMQLMIENVGVIASKLDVEDLASDLRAFTGKTPTDVFHSTTRVMMKLNALLGRAEVAPHEVYSQMVRAGEDVRTILRQADPACRYRINRPQNTEIRVPNDVFDKCVQIRQLINTHAERLGLTQTPLPVKPQQGVIRPRDVFLQTQIIIAELNLLKLRLKTVSSTPLTIEARHTITPSHVYQKAMMVEYLLGQVKSGSSQVR